MAERRPSTTTVLAAGVLLPAAIASAQAWYVAGKVIMDDGTPPPEPATIERVCAGGIVKRETHTDASGGFIFRLPAGKAILTTPTPGLIPRIPELPAPPAQEVYGAQDVSASSLDESGTPELWSCYIRASLAGYTSSRIELAGRDRTDNPNLGIIILRSTALEPVDVELLRVPNKARKAYANALKAIQKSRWDRARAELEKALAIHGDFAEASYTLGTLHQQAGNFDAARKAYRQSVAANPKFAQPYLPLAQLAANDHNWAEVVEHAEAAIKLHPARFPMAYFYHAVAQFNLRSLDAAEQSARKVIELDTRGRVPRAQYILGLVLAAKRDFAAAAGQLRSYLKVAPQAPEAGEVRKLIPALETATRESPAPDLVTEVAARPAPGALRLRPSEVWVPGGIKALAVASGAGGEPPPHRFFADYCRAIGYHSATAPDPAGYLASLRDYFERVAELGSLGEGGRHVSVSLSGQDGQGQPRAERILDLLGWKLLRSGDEVALEPARDSAVQARRQESAWGLGIDELAMQDKLRAGEPFSFDLVADQRARLVLGEEAWIGQFFPNQYLPGGLAEVFARDPRLARLYVGLSGLDDRTAASLVTGLGMKPLANRYIDVLYHYSSALAVGPEAVDVPGGEPAHALWTALAGASPADPSRFFRALSEKDAGKLLGFYFALAQCDQAHQRYLTASEPRARRFYELYRESPELQAGAGGVPRERSFAELLRELPLDGAGRVRFPGGAKAWLRQGSPAHPTEEEILLGLAAGSWEAFVALARLEAHRPEPLDEAAAVLLARRFDESRWVYPYFAALTGVKAPELESFFALLEILRSHDPVRRNHVLGQWHALVKLICLGQQHGRLDPARAAALFRSACDRFRVADSEAALASEAIIAVRGVVAALGGPEADSDRAIREMLLGTGPRQAEYERVLALQQVIPLGVLLRIEEAARRLVSGEGAPAELIRTLEDGRARLPAIEVPEPLGAESLRLEYLRSFRTERLAGAIEQLGRKAAAGSAVRSGLPQLANELLASLHPHLTAALAGAVYAHYFRPDDLLIWADPLFVRKHEFVHLGPLAQTAPLLGPAEFKAEANHTGSYMTGGFAGFAREAGHAAAVGVGRFDQKIDQVLAAQLSALRAAGYTALGDDDLRQFAATVEAGREFVRQAAAQPEAAAALADRTLGLVSLSRRRKLLDAVKLGDAGAALQELTLSDLFLLGRAGTRITDSRLDLLAAVDPDCDRPHFAAAAPYEEYERHFFPERLAERTAEFNLYLAWRMHAEGLPAAAFAELAEPAARRVLSSAEIPDPRDWRATLAALGSLDRIELKPELARR